MKKIVLIVIVALAVFLAADYLDKGKNYARQDEVLEKELQLRIEKGETQIDLKKLTDFDWIQVQLFDAYTPKEYIEETMGINFEGEMGRIAVQDGYFLLVFANDKYAVKTAELLWNNGTYSVLNNRYLLFN